MHLVRSIASTSGFRASIAWTPLIAPLNNCAKQTSALFGANSAANKTAINRSNCSPLANWLVKSQRIFPSPQLHRGAYTPWPTHPESPWLPAPLHPWCPPILGTSLSLRLHLIGRFFPPLPRRLLHLRPIVAKFALRRLTAAHLSIGGRSSLRHESLLSRQRLASHRGNRSPINPSNVFATPPAAQQPSVAPAWPAVPAAPTTTLPGPPPWAVVGRPERSPPSDRRR